MTPKEKAFYLMDKFIRFQRNGIYNVVHEDIAKQYALIAVDEIINNLPLIFEIQQFWEEVKQEIEKL
jgi:hypothetical protein